MGAIKNQWIGVLALFFALATGGAWAADQLAKNSVGPKQLKSNSVKAAETAKNSVGSAEVIDDSLTADDFAPGALPAGPAGPAGATGPAGAAGAAGATGPPGRSALTSLQPGETIRGYLSGDYDEDATPGDWGINVSYPIPLSAVPTATIVDEITDNGNQCTGTATNPTAPPGAICVYELGSDNPPEGGPSSNTHFVVNGNNLFGFEVRWTAAGAGDTRFRGTWAFTQGP